MSTVVHHRCHSIWFDTWGTLSRNLYVWEKSSLYRQCYISPPSSRSTRDHQNDMLNNFRSFLFYICIYFPLVYLFFRSYSRSSILTWQKEKKGQFLPLYTWCCSFTLKFCLQLMHLILCVMRMMGRIMLMVSCIYYK